MDIAERISIVIKSHNLTNSAFADSLGVQRSNISHILSGRSKPGLDFLQKVLVNYPKVSAAWLITGQQPANNLADTSSVSTKTEKSKALDNTEVKDASNTGSSAQFPDKELDYILLVYKDKSFERLKPSEQ